MQIYIYIYPWVVVVNDKVTKFWIVGINLSIIGRPVCPLIIYSKRTTQSQHEVILARYMLRKEYIRKVIFLPSVFMYLLRNQFGVSIYFFGQLKTIWCFHWIMTLGRETTRHADFWILTMSLSYSKVKFFLVVFTNSPKCHPSFRRITNGVFVN